MGYVKKRIRELSKYHGSKKNARTFSENWFKESKNSRTLTEVQQTRSRFEPGKIYVFDYEPITKDLPWFDESPVVLAIEQKGDTDLGINLNLLPIQVKEDLLDVLYDRMEGQINNATSGKREENAKRQIPLRITYDGMKAYLKRFGMDFAIRRYIPSRKTRQTVVSYKKWPEITLCDFIELNGATIGQIRRLFSNQ
jgi:hypothetical protein